MIEEIDIELTKVIKDFDRAVYVEAVRLADETVSPHFLNLSTVDPQGLGVERADREQLERERNERERMERERMERERVEREREQVEREPKKLFKRLKPVEAGYHRMHKVT